MPANISVDRKRHFVLIYNLILWVGKTLYVVIYQEVQNAQLRSGLKIITHRLNFSNVRYTR